MTPALTLMILGGVIVVAIAMLVVVLIARSLDGGASAKPHASASTTASLSAISETLSGGALVKALAFRAAQAKGDDQTPAARKKSTAFAIIGAATAIVVGIAAAFDSDDNDMPPIESTISAGALQGTLLDAGKKSEIVLIVPGSGPTDRNGDNPMGMKAQPYRLLAEGLAAEGISSVRVDKRGMFGSAAAGDPNDVSIAIYANDYRAWVDAIRAQTGAKCVWLLGHSEGALMVSAAAEGRKDVCGLILVSGMGRKMGDVIRAQLQANPANAPVMDSALHALAELEAGRKVDTTGMHPALLPLFAPRVQDYLLNILPVDPVEILRKARKQTLIIQGTTDLQTSVEDAKLLNKAPRTRLELIKGMNHVLKDAPLDRAANIATYSDPTLPLSDDLVREIEKFIEDDD